MKKIFNKIHRIKRTRSIRNRAKKNLFKSFHIAIGTGAIFGSIAISIAVPLSIQYGGVKEIATEDLRVRFPQLKNFLGLTPELAERELKDVYQIEKIEGFHSFRKRRRRAMVPLHSFRRTENVTVYLYQKPHIDNKIFYIETSRKLNEDTGLYGSEKIDLAFVFDGVDMVDLAKTIKLGRNLHLDAIDDPTRSASSTQPYKELFRNMREMAVSSMKIIAETLNLDRDPNNGDPIPSEFENDKFIPKLKAKVKEEREYALNHNEYNTLTEAEQNISERDVFDDVYLHNDIIQEENIDTLRQLIEEIKEESINKIILDRDKNRGDYWENYIHAFSDPVFWSEAISAVVVNKNHNYNVKRDLLLLKEFAIRYNPIDSFEESQNAFLNIINQTIDKLFELFEADGKLNLLNELNIPKDLSKAAHERGNFSIRNDETNARLDKVLQAVDKIYAPGFANTDLKREWDLWTPIDLEVILDKSNTYLKTLIFRSIDRKHHNSFISKTSYNPKFGTKGFTNVHPFKFERPADETAFNSIVLTAQEDVKLTTPELGYILKMGRGEKSYSNDIKYYDDMIAWIKNWFDLYDQYEARTAGTQTNYNFLIGNNGYNSRSWVKDGILELAYDIFNKSIVAGEKIDYKGVNNANLEKFEEYLKSINFMPPKDASDSTVFDPREDNYILMKTFALSLEKVGFNVNKKMIEDFIFKKKRRRRRR